MTPGQAATPIQPPNCEPATALAVTCDLRGGREGLITVAAACRAVPDTVDDRAAGKGRRAHRSAPRALRLHVQRRGRRPCPGGACRQKEGSQRQREDNTSS